MSDAFFDRWILIEFPYRFLPSPEIKKLSKEEKKTHKVQNPDIIQQITTPKELSGFLNWAIEGYTRLRKNKSFSYSETSKTVKEMWIRKSDSFRAFCMDNLKEDYDNSMKKVDLRKKYQQYCRKHRLHGVTDKIIKLILESEYGVSEEQSADDLRTRCWVGVAFVDDVHDDVPTTNQKVYRENMVNTPIENFEKTLEDEKPCSGSTLLETPKEPQLPIDLFLKWIETGTNNERTIIEINKEWKTMDIQKLIKEGTLFESKPGRLRWNK